MLFLIKNLFGIEKTCIFALINKLHRYGWKRKKYLDNKHRGGESGQRGNLYEAYYAIFAIFREIANGNYSTIVSGQVSKFKFLTFAIDDVRDDKGVVLPGVSGMVYPKLGLGNQVEKNSYMPQIVRDRAFASL